MTLAAVFVAAGGCASSTTLGTARTLAPGEMQFAVDAKAPLPVVEVGLRRGITDNVDLGARAGGFYSRPFSSVDGAVDAKVQLRRSTEPHGWDFALAPGVEYQGATDGGPWTNGVDVSVPLLIGLNLGPHQLIFGPRVIGALLWDPNADVTPELYLGTSIAFAWRVHPSVRIVPEAAVYVAPWSRFNTAQYFLFQAGVGVLLGG